MSDDKATIRGRELGRRLRVAMHVAGLTSAVVADALGFSGPRVSRILSGQRGISSVDVSAFLAVCGVTGEAREELLTLAGRNDRGSFVRRGPARLNSFHYHVMAASRVTEFGAQVLPWALRLNAYTEHLHGPGGVLHEDAYHHWDLVRVPYERKAPLWEFILHETVLRTPWGAPEIVAEQLRHLLTLAELPTVSIRVLSIAAGPIVGLPGSFAVLHYARSHPALYRDEGDVATFTDEPDEMAWHTELLDRIDAAALDSFRSRELIARAAEEPALSTGGEVS